MTQTICPVPDLEKAFPSSPACSCDTCRSFCARPGWWTVRQAISAMRAGYASRMMLEVAPDFTYGVLAPAFRGCENGFALQPFAKNGCGFLENGLCTLHATGHLPLECAYCHHDRPGEGAVCHEALGRDWNTPEGRALIGLWSAANHLWERFGIDSP